MIQGVTTGAGGGALGGHLADLKGQNEVTRPGSSRGLVGDTTQDQIRELTKLAGASRAQKPIAHFHADPPPGANWGDAEWSGHWDRLEKEFGLEKQPYAEAIHEKGGREHRHRVYSLYDEKTGRTLRLDHSYARLEKLSRLAEFETNHVFTKGKHNRAVVHALRADGRDDVAMAIEGAGLTDGPPAIAPLTPQDLKQQDRTGIKKADVAKATATAWASSDSPQAFQAALRESGLTLAMGDSTQVIVDQSGNTHGLQKMLAMHARANGEPSPKKADIQARLEGFQLPSLDDVKQAVPVPGQVAPVQPDPVPPVPPCPEGGVDVASVPEVPASASQDVQVTSVDVATPSNDDGKQMPAAASARGPSPKSGGGGGGGSSSPTEQSSPLPSLDVGNGPGEPPGPNATPDEKARYAAKIADYEDRKAKAWLAWIKAWDAQAKKGNSRAPSGGGSSDVGNEKELRGVASDLIREIESRAEQGAAIRAFNTAFAAFQRDNAQGRRTEEQSRGISAPERGQGREGDGYPGRDEPAPRDGRPVTDAGAHRRGSDDGRGPSEGREKSERNPLSARAESLRIGRLAALSDFSRLRMAMGDLNPLPDPLVGLGPKEKKAKVQEFRQELLDVYRQDRDVVREAGRADWRERMAAEKVRALPLAEQLRKGWRHLSPEQRESGWKAIREAREALVSQMKATAKANPPADFRSWLEFVSETDPKAMAVLTVMQEAEERKAKIQQELQLGDVRLEALKSTAPKGERDEEQAARDVKERMKDEHGQREEAAREARKKADEAASRARWWMVWKSHPVRAAARAANEHAETIEHAMRIHTPSQTDFREAQETARSRARSNLRAFQAWEQSPKGVEASALEKSLQGIRNALAGKDVYMRNAILEGGIDAALEEQRRREALEAKRREIELRKAERKQDLETGKVVQFPGPRMR